MAYPMLLLSCPLRRSTEIDPQCGTPQNRVWHWAGHRPVCYARQPFIFVMFPRNPNVFMQELQVWCIYFSLLHDDDVSNMSQFSNHYFQSKSILYPGDQEGLDVVSGSMITGLSMRTGVGLINISFVLSLIILRLSESFFANHCASLGVLDWLTPLEKSQR